MESLSVVSSGFVLLSCLAVFGAAYYHARHSPAKRAAGPRYQLEKLGTGLADYVWIATDTYTGRVYLSEYGNTWYDKETGKRFHSTELENQVNHRKLTDAHMRLFKQQMDAESRIR